MPTVISQTMLNSSTQQVCPGGTIVFTCTTTGSLVLAWTSEEYIGSGRQLDIRSVDPIGTTVSSTINSDTVANLTAFDNDGIILKSMLRIRTGSTTPSVSVSCLNVGDGGINSSTIPLAGM